MSRSHGNSRTPHYNPAHLAPAQTQPPVASTHYIPTHEGHSVPRHYTPSHLAPAPHVIQTYPPSSNRPNTTSEKRVVIKGPTVHTAANPPVNLQDSKESFRTYLKTLKVNQAEATWRASTNNAWDEYHNTINILYQTFQGLSQAINKAHNVVSEYAGGEYSVHDLITACDDALNEIKRATRSFAQLEAHMARIAKYLSDTARKQPGAGDWTWRILYNVTHPVITGTAGSAGMGVVGATFQYPEIQSHYKESPNVALVSGVVVAVAGLAAAFHQFIWSCTNLQATYKYNAAVSAMDSIDQALKHTCQIVTNVKHYIGSYQIRRLEQPLRDINLTSTEEKRRIAVRLGRFDSELTGIMDVLISEMPIRPPREPRNF